VKAFSCLRIEFEIKIMNRLILEKSFIFQKNKLYKDRNAARRKNTTLPDYIAWNSESC
jgi:hypothetical protein